MHPQAQSSLLEPFKKETFNRLKWNQFKYSLRPIKPAQENEIIPNFQSLLQLLVELNACVDIKSYFEEASIADYFINDFFTTSVRELTSNKKLRSEQLQDLVNSYLKELLIFWLKTMHEDYAKLYDMAQIILDPSRSYHETKRSAEQGSSIIPDFMNKPSKEHLEWIQTLKQGDLVDSIKIDKHHSKMCWSPAKVEEVSESRIKIKFLNDFQETSRYLDKKVNANEITLFKTKCKDFDWRLSLKAGNVVDACDKSNIWYSSTILDTKDTLLEDGTVVKELYIGYRIYCDDGDKTDHTGKKYRGWSPRYDEWISSTSPRILQKNSMAKKLDLTFNNSSTPDSLIDDSNDKIYDQEGIRFYVVPRDDYCVSPFFISLVNKFGRLGGFERLNERIEEANNGKEMPLDIVLYLCCIMGNLSPILHREFAVEFIPRFKEAAWKYILSRSDLTQYKIDRIITAFHALLSRIYSQQEKQQIMEDFNLQVCLNCLDSKLLETRLTGLTTLLQFIKDLKNPTQTLFMTNTFLNDYIGKNHILNKVYGLKCHVQIIQRTGALLKYMLEGHFLSQKDFELIWTLTIKKDEQTKLAIYKVLKEVIVHLKDEHIEYILAKVADIAPEKMSAEEITLLHESCKSTGTPILKKAKDFYWGIILNKTGLYQPNVVKLAVEEVSEIMKNKDFKNEKINIIYDCLSNIKEKISVLSSLKLMKELINQYPDNQGAGYAFSKSTCLEHLAEEKNLLDILTKEFKTFKSSVKSQIKKGAKVINEHDLDAIVQGKYSYINHITERVEFAEFVVLNSSLHNRISIDQLLSDIWDITVTNALIPNERDVMYKWINQLCESKQRSRAAIWSLTELFNKKMNFNTSYNPQNTRIEDFECIENVFLAVNKDSRKISKKAKASGREFGYKVNVMPHELEGITCIWEFALLPENGKAAKKASSFLKNLYRNIDDELESNIIKIRQKYIETCIRNLEKAIKGKNKLSESAFTMRSTRCLKLMSSMIDESEKRGMGSLKPHSRLVKGAKGEFLTLIIQEKITDGSSGNEIKVIMASNAKVFDLRVEIARQTKCFWDQIELVKCLDSKEIKEIRYSKNGRTLKEMGFKDCEMLSALKKPGKEIPQTPLLMPDKTLNPLFKRIVLKWFRDFSKDDKMSPEQCGAFICSCTNQECKAEDRRVKDIFQTYDNDNNGYLTESNFLEFYLLACQQRPQIVWGNLRAHSYGNDLKTATEAVESVDITSLARYMISTNDEHFAVVFSLLDLGGQIATEAWKILKRLPTNLETFSDILTLKGVKDNLSDPDWNIILDLTSKHKLMYTLYIIEFLIETDPDEAEGSIRKVVVQDFRRLEPSIINSSKSWQLDFITLGGFAHLARILSLYTNKEDFSKLNAVDKDILSTVQKIFHNCLCLSFAINGPFPSCRYEVLCHFSRDFIQQYREPLVISPFGAEGEEKVNPKVEMFKNSIGSKLLSTINLKGLLDTILLIGCNILSKSASLEQEDRFILEYSLSIILSSLHFDANSMSNQDSPFQTCEKFILEGLLYPQEVNVRKYLAHSIHIFCQLSPKIGNLDTSKCFLDLLMKYLLSSTENNSNKNFNEFFELILKLIEKICSNQNNSEIFPGPQGKLLYFNNLFTKTFERLQSHISSENRRNPNIQDQILIGLLSICEKSVSLLHSIGNSLDSIEYNLVEEIFNTSLFDCRTEKKTSSNVKCHNDDSRSKAYKLLIALCKDNSASISTMQKYIKDLICLIRELTTSKESSNVSRRSSVGYVGIQNLKEIGYMNAILQQLFMNPAFRYAILSADNVKEFNEKEMVSNNDEDDILYQLQRMFGFLELSDKVSYDPEGFCSAFKDVKGLPINVSVQEDAHEFLIRLFDKLEQRLNQTSSKDILKDIYKGTIWNQFTCGVCGTKREQQDSFYTLTVQVEKKNTLEDSLKYFVGQDYISQCFCEICKKNTEFTTKAQLSDLPHVLPIHLQRVGFDFDTMQICKINTKFEFPLTLNVESYCKKAEQFSASKEYYEYKLVGIVTHDGNASSGCYYSDIRNNNTSDKEDRWLKFNDSIVEAFDLKDIETEWFGGKTDAKENTRNAYILFYEKVIQPSTKLIARKPELKPDSNQDNLSFEENSIKRYISPALYKNIEEDNRRFMLVNQICTDAFYNFMNEFCEIIKLSAQVPISNELKESIEDLVHIQAAVVFQLPNRDSDDQIMSQTISNLKGLLYLNPEMAWLIFDQFIRESAQIERFLMETDPQIRSRSLQIALIVINLLISHHKLSLTILTNEMDELTNEQRHLQGINLAVVKFLDTLVQWIPIEVSNHLKQSTEFFEFWCEFFISGESQMNYLYRKNFITTLISFYLGKDSPIPELSYDTHIIPNNSTQLDLSSMMQTIANMVRRTKTDTRTGTLPFTSLARKGLATYNLSSNDLKCLSCSKFYEKALKDKYTFDSLGSMGCIIQHLSFENESFSKIFAEICLQNLKGVSMKECNRYLDTISYFVTLQDTLQLRRIEWIFGHPKPVFDTSNKQDKNLKNIGVTYVTPFEELSSLINRILCPRSNDVDSQVFALSLKQMIVLMGIDRMICEYILALPPPSSKHHNFTHWISDFIKDVELDELKFYLRKEILQVQAYWDLLERKIKAQSKFRRDIQHQAYSGDDILGPAEPINSLVVASAPDREKDENSPAEELEIASQKNSKKRYA